MELKIENILIVVFVFYLGAQGAYPPPSGFQQYPPPYPGSAVENAPPLATKSDDYNRQSAFNPNV